MGLLNYRIMVVFQHLEGNITLLFLCFRYWFWEVSCQCNSCCFERNLSLKNSFCVRFSAIFVMILCCILFLFWVHWDFLNLWISGFFRNILPVFILTVSSYLLKIRIVAFIGIILIVNFLFIVSYFDYFSF